MIMHSTEVGRDQCPRCGGLMVPEEIREVRQMGWRCVMCGEHIDPLILEHRRKMCTPAGAREFVVKSKKAVFN